MHRYYAECKKRASLVPAAAVIPALRAYIKVVAFKTPVVEIAWSGVQRGGERERKEKGCNKGVTFTYTPALRERGEGRGEGKRKRVCTCLTGAFQILNKLPSLRPEPLSQGARCVRRRASLPPLSFFLSLNPLGACLVFLLP